jgi:hypothetical protein
MLPESIDIPMVFRKPSSNDCSSFNPSDILPVDSKKILPYSHFGRITSYASSMWGMQTETVITTPIALMALEMHKILWYLLMEKHLPLEERNSVVYWSNDTEFSSINLDAINFDNGVFIKIADRSTGGGNEVLYAKDKEKLISITSTISNDYSKNNELYKKHIYVIEPAYITLKKHAEKDYNVTGRAFITLIYNKETKEINVKIAGAKWIFPVMALQNEKTQDQMLSNIKHSIQMLSLNSDELQNLSSCLVNSYGEVFKVGFEKNNLMEYFGDEPTMVQFKSCIRPHSSYLQCLTSFYSSDKSLTTEKSEMLNSLINGLVGIHYFKNFSTLLDFINNSNGFFSMSKGPSDLLKNICLFSFMENYVAHIKTSSKEQFETFPFLEYLVVKEDKIKSSLNKLITEYLDSSHLKYSSHDKNKSLREAAYYGDKIVVKLLVYTGRADVNALSPTNKTALHYAHQSENTASKDWISELLKQAGAKEPTISNTTGLKP